MRLEVSGANTNMDADANTGATPWRSSADGGCGYSIWHGSFKQQLFPCEITLHYITLHYITLHYTHGNVITYSGGVSEPED